MYAKGVKRQSIASKYLLWKGSRSKKRDDLSGNQTDVSEWAAQLSNSLGLEGMLEQSNVLNNVSYPDAHADNEVQWIENSTFEGDLQFNVQ
ncbi:hypothetical protein V6N13_108658 [Hibiscus sabdariffa]